MIYTAPCLMFWMRAYPSRGQVGGGWALEFPSFLGPVKWERSDRRVPFGNFEANGPDPHVCSFSWLSNSRGAILLSLSRCATVSER
jgi:hypothetical protein